MRISRSLSKTAAFYALLLLGMTGCGGAAPGIDAPSNVRAEAHVAPAQPARGPSAVPASTPAAPAPPAAEGVVHASTAAAPGAGVNASPAGAKDASKPTSNATFLIAYTGSLAMMVEERDVASSLDKMVDVAEAHGGHLGGRSDANVTLKVPSASFRAVLSDIEKLGLVTSRSVSAEDVTEEFKDAEVRLANLKATRTRIQEFLAKASNINDMLTLEQQLERVTLDIDRIEGRMRFLRERTAFSTISIHVSPKPVAIVVKEPPPPPPPPPAPIVAIELPAKWLEQLGTERLLQVKK